MLEIDPALDPRLDHLSRRALLEKTGLVAAATVAALSGAEAQDATKAHALDDPNLEKKDITFDSKTEDGITATIKAFLATPKGRGKRGSVIVVHEIFGLNDHIKDVACRFAQAGYNALAINLFTREGEPPSAQGGFAPLMQFVGKIADAQVVADLKAAMKMLRARRDSNKKCGVVGFCWGGRVSMVLDGYAEELDAAVAYYGRIVGQKSDTQPLHALDLVDKMKAPLLGHFGGLDTGIPVADVEKLQAALKEKGKTVEIHIYEKAGHAFNNDTRPSYQKESAELAWKRTLEWYAKYLK
jgi:carboxymethylenebutenolidase